MGYDHIPGHAAWKFVFKDMVVYRNRNREAPRYYWKYRDRQSFTVYARGHSGGWEFVTENIPLDKCPCGGAFETSNGEIFRYQEYPLVNTIDSISAMMNSPVLCQICYYKGELKAGRWAPRSVKKHLGLET
jgi:hypothetical protein